MDNMRKQMVTEVEDMLDRFPVAVCSHRIVDWHQAEVNRAVTEALEEVKSKGANKYDGGLYDAISEAWVDYGETDGVWTEASNWLDREIDAIKARYGQKGSDG